MRIAILTFDGFNEIDSFVALNILNRVRREGWNSSALNAPEHSYSGSWGCCTNSRFALITLHGPTQRLPA